MELSTIVFPVYKLGQTKPHETDGVVFFINQYEREGKEITTIVDDNKIAAETLSRRRLELIKNGVSLFQLRTAVFFLADLIKIAKNSKYWFIDSSGKVFQYKKTRMVNLIFKEIDKVLPIPTGGSIIQLVGMEQRFKCLTRLMDIYKYAGLLELDSKSYVLYGVYEKKPKDTKRKI
jgi:hypothetical protein